MARNNLPSNYRILDSDMWTTIRARYENGDPPKILLREYGLPESTFYKRRKVEGWTVSESNKALQTMDVDKELISIESSIDRAAGAFELPAVITEDPPLSLVDADANDAAVEAIDHRRHTVNQSHIESAALLRDRIDTLMSGEYMGASPDKQPGAVKDLTMALERLQKIERLALKMDDEAVQSGPSVVILCPQKLSPDAWAQEVGKVPVEVVP